MRCVKLYVLKVKIIERIVIEMEIETPCKICKRVNDDKRNCVTKCPAVMLYRQNSAVCFDKKEFDKINRELKNLADVHAPQFTEERTDSAEMIPESGEDGEMFMSDMEIDPDLSDELDIDETQKLSDEIVGADAFVQKPKNQKNAEKQQKPSEGTMTKKGKYTKKNKEENILSYFQREDPAKGVGVFLDMSEYPQIYERLKEMSKESMLPIRHIIASLISKGLLNE